MLLANDINGASMSRNNTLGVQFPLALLETNSDYPQRAFDNILVEGNICVDCSMGFSHSKAGGTNKYIWGVTVANNTFDCDPFHTSPKCGPVSASYDANNLGVAVPGTGAEFSHVVIDANPTSGTYGTVVNQPKAAHSAAPTSGTYVQGHLVRDASGSSLGWRRATTGSGHVVGTDWVKLG